MSFSEASGYYFQCESCNKDTHKIFETDLLSYFLDKENPTTFRYRFNCDHCGHTMELGFKKKVVKKKEYKNLYSIIGFGYKNYRHDGVLR